jgi:PAS domain S-box-containing protein
MSIKKRSATVELQKINEQLQKEIIERKKAEEEIKHSVSLLDATLESTADGILVVDREGKIEKFNRKFVQMWRIPESILASKDVDRALAFALDQLKEPEGFLKKVRGLYNLPEAESYDVLEFKDGRVFERYLQPQRIGDQIIGRVSSFRDVTERKWMEQTLIRSEEEAKRLSQENAIMAEIGRIISSTLDINEVYERFAEEVRILISFDRIVINIINPENNNAIIAYLSGVDVQGRRIGDFVSMIDSATGECLRTRSSLLFQTESIDEVANRFPGLLPTFKAGLRSMIFIPLISKDQVIGALFLQATKLNAYSEGELRLAERVGTQIAGAIANAQLFIERKRAEAEKEKLIIQLQKALSEVKQLSGLLPICASCKKIRDDKGYWNQIETYIRDRSEAEFTHGICPDCFKKLYPDIEI